MAIELHRQLKGELPSASDSAARKKNFRELVKGIRELVDEACYLLLFCEERSHVAFENHRQQKKNEAISKILKPAKAAALVTGLSVTADARGWFNKFVEFLS